MARLVWLGLDLLGHLIRPVVVEPFRGGGVGPAARGSRECENFVFGSFIFVWFFFGS
jgi:hypothetical protein